ncbi:hypothetical protein JOE67_001110 [Microbacterium esteraromaticum]|nr:hypothetical protein [Microbacterium esteraromaticum]
MQACMTDMSIISMPDDFISVAIASIIIESMARTAFIVRSHTGSSTGQVVPPAARVRLRTAHVDGRE